MAWQAAVLGLGRGLGEHGSLWRGRRPSWGLAGAWASMEASVVAGGRSGAWLGPGLGEE
jgi:hypothetical protein